MVSSRVLLLLAAICLQTASAARIKKSTTQRKLADRASLVTVGQHAGSPVLVSHRLVDERDKISGFIAEQEANLKRYELDKVATASDLAHQKWRRVHEGKWYKVWNWKIWSDILNQIEKEIERLEAKETSLASLIATATETINNLQDADAWVHDASKRAAKHEAQIASLDKQIAEVEDDHTKTVAAYLVAEKQAKEAGDEKVRMFEELLADLNREVAKYQSELASLHSGDHKLHAELDTAKKNIQKTIAQHEETISNKTAQIAYKTQEIEDAETSKNQSQGKYDTSLTKLREDRSSLEEERKGVLAQIKEDKAELARVTSEGQAAIKNLKEKLRQQVEKLKAELKLQVENVHSQKVENDATLSALKAAHNEEIGRKTQQIDAFQAARKDAHELYEILRNEHEVSGDAVVSEALHKARADLEYNLRLQKDAHTTALENIQRIEQEISDKEADFQSESKLWKFWNWRWWSSTLPDLENEIKALKVDETKAREYAKRCKDNADRLTAQIQSKLDAEGMAKEQEAVVEDLDGQIQEKQTEKTQALTRQQSERGEAKETGEAQLKLFEDIVKDYKTQQNDAEKEIQQIESGAHDEHRNLEEAKAQIQKIIDARAKTNESLTEAINEKEFEELRQEREKKEDLATHDRLLNELRSSKKDLQAHQSNAENAKKNAKARLTEIQDNAITEIAGLQKALGNTITDLEQDVEDAKDDLADEKLAREKVLQVQGMKHFKDVDSLSDQKSNLEQSKKAAQAALKEIKSNHLS